MKAIKTVGTMLMAAGLIIMFAAFSQDDFYTGQYVGTTFSALIIKGVIALAAVVVGALIRYEQRRQNDGCDSM